MDTGHALLFFILTNSKTAPFQNRIELKSATLHNWPSPVLTANRKAESENAAATTAFNRRFRHNDRSVPPSSTSQSSSEFTDFITEQASKRGPLKPGLYLVGTPIGNLEDITLRALRVLKSADVILSEDTRHFGKLLHYYSIKTPLLSYHKFNESQREQTVLKRLKRGEIIALISDAGMPGISDPGTELAKLCVDENILVIPIPGPSAFLTALSASGLSTDEFTFVGFLPRHAGSRKERLMASASETTTQIFYVPPHKLCQFLEESSPIFGDSRRCVIARELTKIHEEFWRGTLGKAKEVFSTHQPKGEITLLIEGNANCTVETPSECQLENELRELISSGHSLSSAVKLVAQGTSMKKKMIYSLALRKFGKKSEAEDSN
ncbi:PREDICTED: ribosomal RNA small subunit methyltransferase I isoform X1 [Theobroma cacao]|uniref:Ribosomal RNA small subunit methyltransferase I isoform X1 n=1 Tax=Theobroma cacao TaxID=3641 RepID=A0AB32WUM5_THECC|nr:PREDICTED: ribosomal RNA small subunit methyltransferase I isoform X1 [Theobroma cacao]XP_017981298.1 PREDICTED: ribosomal RNA small subunit methyltransferase I isoform X1 [Theobroma cacao]